MFNFPNILLNYILINLIVMKCTGDMFEGNLYMLIGLFLISYPVSSCMLWLITKYVPAHQLQKDDAFDEIFEDKVTANGLRDVFVYTVSIYLSITSSVNFYHGDIVYIYKDKDLITATLFTCSVLVSLFAVFVQFKLNERSEKKSTVS